MTEDRSKRSAIITGAAQGLGAGIARALHGAGHPVLICDINLTAAKQLAAELDESGPAPAQAVEVDVRSQSQIVGMVEAMLSWQGNVGILVNNAAATVAREFMDITASEWDEVLSINLRSVLLTSQAVFPAMRDQCWGRIINLASVAGQRGGPQIQGAHYATSKAGIVGLSRYLAHEMAPYGICVNAIAPGPVETEQTALVPAEKIAAATKSIPLGRIGNVAEVGGLVNYLASDLGGFVVGATIDVNGGVLMR